VTTEQVQSAAVVRRNRLTLIGLFALAIVPLGAAYWLYQSTRSAAPWSTTNRGELLTPIRSVAGFDLASLDPRVSMVDSGVWWLVTVSNGACDSVCEQAMFQLHQLHVLLGKDADRVKRALVELGNAPVEPQLAERFPQVSWFTGSAEALRAGVYIIDPLGNVVLYYTYADAGKPVLEDLKKLLKVSHIG
jgi:cytochrome oxidase Cu insertion factor (SCO1/SenC/PrrC family)